MAFYVLQVHGFRDIRSEQDVVAKDLSGFRSICAAVRYRIIYKIDKETVIIYILAAGIRKEGDKKDIYEIAKKLLTAGLLD